MVASGLKYGKVHPTLSSNAEGIARDHVFSDFRYISPFRRYSRSKSEVVENSPKFCMFWPPFFRGRESEGDPHFWNYRNLSNRTVFDHVAKFRGDRLRDLGENLAKEKKKQHGQNRRPPALPYWRPNKRCAVGAQTARSRGKVLSIQYVYYFRAYQRQITIHGV